MHSFELLPHSADLRMRVKGNAIQDVFHAALEGMNDILKKGFCKTNPVASVHDEIIITSVDGTTLLIDFLSELLTRSYEKRVVYCKLDFLHLHDTNLRATISGSEVDEFDEDVKAVTYHEAEIKQNEHGVYETLLVFDI